MSQNKASNSDAALLSSLLAMSLLGGFRRRLFPGSRARLGLARGQFLTYHLPNRLDHRALLNEGHQCIIDQCLIVARTSTLDLSSEVINHSVVKPDRYLGLTRLTRDHRATLGVCEINVPIGF